MPKAKTATEHAAAESGFTARDMSGRELLDRLFPGRYSGSPTALAGYSQEPAASPEQAFKMARSGSLETWQRVYEPGAEMFALSEIVKVHHRLDKIEEMLIFLVGRSGA